MSVRIVSVVSGPVLGYGVIMRVILLHQCDHPDIISAAAVVWSWAGATFFTMFYRDLLSLQDFLPRCEEASMRVCSSVGAHTCEGWKILEENPRWNR